MLVKRNNENFGSVLAEDLGLDYVVFVKYGCDKTQCKRFQGRIVSHMIIHYFTISLMLLLTVGMLGQYQFF
jgi:hypothetical protein